METTAFEGARLLPCEAFADARGPFITPWTAGGAAPIFRPESLHFSHNLAAGTLRGLHYQAEPFAQAKLVHCVRGRVFDVTVDLRPDSPGFKSWSRFELAADRPETLWIPAGFAHGFLTLEKETSLAYLISGVYRPESALGLRWNDPAFGIEWPDLAEMVISDKDRNLPDFLS